MAKSKEELLEKLSECVVEMEDEEVVDVANEYVESGYPALDGIMEGLVDGMNKASTYTMRKNTSLQTFFFAQMQCIQVLIY